MKMKVKILFLTFILPLIALCQIKRVAKRVDFQSPTSCNTCQRVDHFSHLDLPLFQYSTGSFMIDDQNKQIHMVVRQNSHDRKTFTALDLDIDLSNGMTFNQLPTDIGTFQLYNQSVYGFTYNKNSREYVDMLIFNRYNNQLEVHKVVTPPVEKSYFKVVTKDTRLIEDFESGNSGVYMVKYETSDGFFDMYIAANVQNDQEWYRSSKQQGVNESVRGLHYDSENQIVVMIVEVKANRYFQESTTYETFADTQITNQTNIAIVVYDRYFGNKKYIILLGNPSLNDTFNGMDSFGANIYVLMTTNDPPQWSSERKFNIILYEIRADTGIINKQTRMGSLGIQSYALDIKTNFKGIYILAEIGSFFCIDTQCSTNSKVWDTGLHLFPSIALILIKYGIIQHEIVEIESRGSNIILQNLQFKPQRFFIHQTSNILSGNDFVFVFVSQRANYSGLYYTVYNTNQNALQKPTCTQAECIFCSYQDSGYCLQCSGLKPILQDGFCVSAVSNGYFLDTNLITTLQYAQKCHYTCSTCITYPECTACATTVLVPNSDGRCLCSLGEYESNGVCSTPSTKQDLCQPREGGVMDNKCMAQCPQNSLEYFNFGDLVKANPRTQSRVVVGTNLVFKLKTRSKPLVLNISNSIPDNATTLPTDFTFSFWIIKKEDGTNLVQTQNFDILNAFDRLYFKAQSISSAQHCLSVFFAVNGIGSSLTLPNVCNPNFPMNKWIKLSVSMKSQIGSIFDIYMVLYQPHTLPLHLVYSSLSQADFYQKPFNSQMILGAHSLAQQQQPYTFPGSFREIIYMSTFLSPAQLKQDSQRMYRGYGLDKPQILAYFRLYEKNADTLLDQNQIEDYSSYRSNSTLIMMKYDIIQEPLNLEIWDDIAECQAVQVSKTVIDSAVMRGDFLKSKLQQINIFYGFNGAPASTQDMIEICLNSCAGPVQAIFQVIGVTPTGLILNGNTTKTPYTIKKGRHYEICYKKFYQGTSLTLPLGQTYLIESMQYVYPFNRGIILNQQTTFTGQGGDLAVGDELIYTNALKCDDIDSIGTTKVVFTRLADSSFTLNTFFVQGLYLMCWRSSMAKDLGQATYLQVNDFNYWMAVGKIRFSDNLSPYSVNLQEKFTSFNIETQIFLPGDQFKFYQASTFEDCYIPYRLGDTFTYWNMKPNGVPYFPPMWFGTQIGTYGISPLNDQLHICYHTQANYSDGNGKRIANQDISLYEIKVKSLAITDPNWHYPEISHFFTDYGGTIAASMNPYFAVWPYPSTTTAPKQLYPAQHPVLNQKGRFEIRRVAVDQSGDIQETSEVLWKQQDLTHLTGYKTSQGDLICGINGLCSINITDVLIPGEIYQLVFFSYSFLIKDSGQDYYLFGNSAPSVQPLYKHLFFVRGWTLENKYPIISYEQSYLEFSGTNLLYQNNSRARGLQSTGVTNANFTTKAINVTFYVTKSVLCSIKRPPHATVLQEDIQNDKFVVRDLEFNDCESGLVYANVYLWRGIQNVQTGVFSNLFVTSYRDFYLGTFGCHSDCLRCNGTSSSDCILCKNPETTFLHKGSCITGCPDDSPFFEPYRMIFNNTWVTGRRCLETCPEATYPNVNFKPIYNAVPCQPCFEDCQSCLSDTPQHCLRCMPIRFNFRGMCLQQCPDNNLQEDQVHALDYVFKAEYSNYTCIETKPSQQMNQSGMLNVTFVPMGYRKRIPKDQIMYFRVAVSNVDGNVTQVLWKQIEPDQDLTSFDGTVKYWTQSEVKNKFIFDGLANMNVQTKYLTTLFSYQKLRMSSFNYFKQGDAFRFLVKVENTRNYKFIDAMELTVNDPPKAREVLITQYGKYHNYTMRTVLNITTINHELPLSKSSWYDSMDDLSQELSFKLYLDTGEYRYLIYPSTYRQESFSIVIPFISQSYAFQTVDFYVYAVDKYAATTYKYLSMSITNDYDRIKTRGKVFKEFQSIINNGSIEEPYYQLMISNFFDITFEQPRLSVISGSYCLSDYHCFQHGQCLIQSDIPRCLCQQDYIGEYCQMTVNEYSTARVLSEMTLNQIDKYFKNHYLDEQYKSGDLEYLVMVMRGFMQSFETVDLIQIQNGLQKIQKCLDAHLEVSNTYLKAFYNDYFELMSRILGRFHFEKLRLISDPYISQEQMDIRFSELRLMSQLLQYCINEFSRQLLIKMNKQSFFDYQYQGNYLQIHLYRMFSQTLLNNTRLGLQTIFKLDEGAAPGQEVEVRAPPEFINKIPDINEVSDVRIKFIKYIANPYMIEHLEVDQMIDSSIVVFELMNVLGERIDINISSKVNRTGFIQIYIPYQEMKKQDQQSLKCKTLDEQSGRFSSQGCGIEIFDKSNCLNCPSDKKTAVCFCSHLSTFAVIFDQGAGLDQIKQGTQSGNLAGISPKLGIYTDFYGMDYWRESFGFIAIVGAIITYSVGLLFSIIFDIKPQKLMRFRIMRDFRSVDTYLNARKEKLSPTHASHEPISLNIDKNQDLLVESMIKASQQLQLDSQPLETTDVSMIDQSQKQPLNQIQRPKLPRLDDFYEEQNISNLIKAKVKGPQFEGGDKEENKEELFTKVNNQQFQDQRFGGTHQNFHQPQQNNHILNDDNVVNSYLNPSQTQGSFMIKQQPLDNTRRRKSIAKQDILIVEDEQQIKPQRTQSGNRKQPMQTQARQAKLKRQPVADVTMIKVDKSAISMNHDNPETSNAKIMKNSLIKASRISIFKRHEFNSQQEFEENEKTNAQNIKEIPEKCDNQEFMEEEFKEPEVIQQNKERNGKPNLRFNDSKKIKDELNDQTLMTTQMNNFETSSNVVLNKKADIDLLHEDTRPNSQQSKTKVQDDLIVHEEDEHNGAKVLTKEELKIEAERNEEIKNLQIDKELETFSLYNMIKYGNPISNFFAVDSLLFPRHARWTLLFMNIILIWFFCAVIYNNTKSPLDVPDLSKKASKLAMQELWIAISAPFGNMLMMYLLTALFRISDARIKYAPELASLQQMLNELQKEMTLRFMMAYFIAMTVAGAVFYYILLFTSTFGWKTSWSWWFSGCGAAFLNFIVYDFMISFANWIIYKIYKPLGRKIQGIRSIKQAREDA